MRKPSIHFYPCIMRVLSLMMVIFLFSASSGYAQLPTFGVSGNPGDKFETTPMGGFIANGDDIYFSGIYGIAGGTPTNSFTVTGGVTSTTGIYHYNISSNTFVSVGEGVFSNNAFFSNSGPNPGLIMQIAFTGTELLIFSYEAPNIKVYSYDGTSTILRSTNSVVAGVNFGISLDAAVIGSKVYLGGFGFVAVYDFETDTWSSPVSGSLDSDVNATNASISHTRAYNNELYVMGNFIGYDFINDPFGGQESFHEFMLPKAYSGIEENIEEQYAKREPFGGYHYIKKSGWEPIVEEMDFRGTPVAPQGNIYYFAKLNEGAGQWEFVGPSLQTFGVPLGFDIDDAGNVYVIPSSGGKVLKGDLNTSGSWTEIGSALGSAPRYIDVLPNGHVVAMGDFTLGGNMENMAIYDGTSWTAETSARVTTASSYLRNVQVTNGQAWVMGDYTGSASNNARYLLEHFSKVELEPDLKISNFSGSPSATPGGASTPGTMNVIGTNLTGDVTVSVDAAGLYELSTDNASYASSINLTQSGGAVNQQIYVRIKSSATDKFISENLTISSTGKNDIYIPVLGSVQPPNLVITAVDVSKAFNDPLPTFNVSYSGFVGSDDASVLTTQPVVTTTATASSNVGTYTLTVTNATDDFYKIIPQTGTLTINKADQVLTWDQTLPVRTIDDGLGTISLSPSVDSGQPINYNLSVGGIGSITSDVLTPQDAGSVDITAIAPASANYNESNSVTKTFTINKADQSVVLTTPPPGTVTFGDAPLKLDPTGGNSNNEVTFVSDNPGVITTNDDSTLTYVGAGSATITYGQVGNGNYNAAPDQQFTVTVEKFQQTVSYPTPPAAFTFGDAAITLTGTGTAAGSTPQNGLVYESSDPAVAAISGTTLTPGNAGTAEIKFYQLGDANRIADTLKWTVTVAPRDQVVTLDPIVSPISTQQQFVQLNANVATPNSGNPIVYTSSNLAVALISGDQVVVLGEGSTTIKATIQGDANHNFGESAGQVLTIQNVATASQNITFPTLADATIGDPNVSLNAAASTGNPVHYQSSDTTVAKIVGSQAQIVGVGATVIRAITDATASHFQATATRTLTVNSQTQNLTFDSFTSPLQWGAADFNLSAMTDSGLPIRFESSNTDVASVVVNGSTATVNINGIGTATLTAIQDGNGTIGSSSVSRTLTINKADQSISFTSPGATVTMNDVFDLDGVSSSGLPVTYMVSDPTKATLEGSRLTIISGTGSFSITASQTGNAQYNAAPDVVYNLTLSKASQTYVMYVPATIQNVCKDYLQFVGETPGSSSYFMNASGGGASQFGCSGLYTWKHSNLGGGFTFAVTRAADDNYEAYFANTPEGTIVSAIEPVSISNFTQTLTYSPGLTFNVTGTASSFTSSYAPVATVGAGSGSATVTVHGAGVTSIVAVAASQTAGVGRNYALRTLTVEKADQTINFPAIATQTLGSGNVTLSTSTEAVGPSGTYTTSLSTRYESSDPDIATIVGNTMTLHNIGTVTITAYQDGDGNYNTASPVAHTFNVIGNASANQTVDLARTDVLKSGTTITLPKATDKGINLTYAVTSGPATVVNGNELQLTGVGTVTIQASNSGSLNFNAFSASETYTVYGVPVVTLNAPKDHIYSATAPVITNSGTNGSGVVTTPVLEFFNTDFTSIGTSIPVNAGTYFVNASITDGPVTTTVGDTLIIAKDTVIATFDNQTRLFGVSNAPLTISYSGFKGPDTEADLDNPPVAQTNATATTDVGSYTIYSNISPTDNNYVVTTAFGTLTINQANATVTVTSATELFDGNPKPLSITVDPTGLTLDVVYEGINGTTYGPVATPPTAPGEYQVTATVNETNYQGSNTGTLNIQDRVTITASEVTITPPASLVYDASPKVYAATPNGALTPALPAADLNVTYEGRNGTTYAASATAPTNAGDYTATVTVDAANPDYKGSLSTDFTITPATTSIVLTLPGTNYTYTGLPQGVTATANDLSSNPSLSVLVEYSVQGASTFSSTVPRNGGTYDVRVNLASSETNYSAPEATGSYTIDKVDLIIIPPNRTITYGLSEEIVDSDLFNYTGFVNGEDHTNLTYNDPINSFRVSYADPGATNPLAPYYSVTGSPYANAIVWTGVTNDVTSPNYNLLFQGAGDLTVLPRAIEITADDRIVAPGGDPNVGNTVTLEASNTNQNTGLAPGESISDFSGTLTFANISETASGIYPDVIIPSGLTNSNYTITFVPGELRIDTIDPVIIWNQPTTWEIYTPTLTASANVPGTFQYFLVIGSEIQVTPGFDRQSPTTLLTRVRFTPDDQSSYNIVSVDRTITFTLRQLTIAADDQQLLFGTTPDPTLTYTLTTGSMASGHSLFVPLQRAAGTAVGDYAITEDNSTSAPGISICAGGICLYGSSTDFEGNPVFIDVSGSYNVTFVPGNFRIFDKTVITSSDVVFNAPASLTYDGIAKTYTATPASLTPALPTGDLELTYEGRNTTTYANSVTPPTDGGDYTVIATVKNTNPDYQGSVSQDFTITPAGTTISLNLSGTNPIYDGNPQGISPTANDLSASPTVSLVTEYSASGAGTFSTAVPVDAGTYDVRVNIASSETNYTASEATGTYTIDQATQTITFNPVPQVACGETTIDLSLYATSSIGATISFASSDLAVATISGNIATIVGTGTTTITASQAGSTNYAAAMDQTQTLVINAVQETVTADNPANVQLCDGGPYTLPALTSGNYFSGTGGTGTAYNAGDQISSDITLYVYAVGSNPSCTDENSFAITIENLPVDQPSNVNALNSYTLPALTNGNYFTGTGGTGTALNAGDVISSSQTIYVYNTNAGTGCTREASFVVTITNAAALHFDQAGSLSNYDYLSVPDNNSLDVNDFTFEAWVNFDQLNTVAAGLDWRAIFNKSRYSDSYGLMVYAPSKSMTFYHGGLSTGATTYSWSGLTAGTWYHVAVKYEAAVGKASILIDGVEVQSSTGLSGSINVNSESILIGASRDVAGDPYPFDGAMDEIRLWNVARTDAEILENKDIELQGTESGLVLYYDFNEGTIDADNTGLTQVPDQSSTGNNATFNRFALTGTTSNYVDGSGNGVVPGIPQNITFNALSNVTFGDADFNLPATASSGLDVTYVSSDPTVATVSGNTVTIVGVGTTTFTASQAGDATYLPAANVTQDLTVDPLATSINLNLPGTNPTYSGVGQGISPTANDTGGSPTLSLVTEYSPQGAGTFSATPPVNTGTYDVRVNLAASETNYTATQATGTFTIDKAPLTARLDDASIVYGEIGANNHPVTYTGFVNGESESVLNVTLGSPTAIFLNSGTGGNYNVGGPYTGAITWQSNPELRITSNNYLLSFEPGDLTSVTPRPVNVTASPKTITYGEDANVGHTVILEPYDEPGKRGLANGETVVDFTGTVLFDNITEVNVGVYAGTIIPNGGLTNANYAINYVAGELTIVEKALTITADNRTIIYGDDANTGNTVTYSGFITGESESVLGGTLAFANIPEVNVGSYPEAITPQGLTSNNYNISFVSGDLNIGTRSIFVRAQTENKVYGEADPAFTPILASGTLVSGDVFTGTMTRVAGEDVGSYAINQGTLTAGANYNLTFLTTGSLNITRKLLTITADNRIITYGEDANTGNAVTYTGFITGENESVLGGTLSFDNISQTDAGSYPGVIVPNGLTSANYNISFVNGDLIIGQLPLVLTSSAVTKVYGDVDPAFNIGFISGMLINGDVFSGELIRDVGEDVGSYFINQGTLDHPNYTITFIQANFDITARPITITADPASKTYGDADPAFTYQLTAGSLAGSDAFTGALARIAGENIGTYALNQGTLEVNANYNITFVPSNLTIGARAITVTADAKGKTYGDTDPTLTYQITTGALQGSDLLTGTLTRVAGESVGTYAIQQGTLDNNNYAITYISDDLTIGTRALTVTADVQTKVYGDADPALTYQITSGALQGSDALTGDLSRVAGEDVGNYAIEQGTLDAGSNYALSFVSDHLTISTRALTVTADAQSKTYGDVDPSLTYQITSGALQSSDVLTGALTRVVGEDVGSYAIQQGTLDAGSNYAVTYVSDDLTIVTRAITITANPIAKVYGNSDPAFTYNITSGALQGSDLIAGAIGRAAGEDVGAYAMNQGTLDAGGNYAITFVSANLIVVARNIIVTAEDKSKTYGDSDPVLTYTSEALSFSDTFIGSLSRDAGEDVGNYTITQGSLSLSSNYSLIFLSGSLTINARGITVAADAASKTYGDADPDFTYQITSGVLQGSDVLSGALDRVAGEDVGVHAINQGTLDNTNYAITFVSDDLTIDARAITVTADAQSKNYGNADPVLTYQVTNGVLQGSDMITGDLTRNVGEDTGNYTINQGTLTAGANYALTYVSNDLTINQRPIGLLVSGTSKVYGESDPALVYSLFPGSELVAGDSFTGELSRDPGEDVGTYPIGVGTLTAGPNYDVSITIPASLEITPIDLSISADSKTKVQGTADPALTYTITSGALINGDLVSGGISRIAGETLGDYAIQQGTLTAGGNYAIAFTDGTLTITDKLLQMITFDPLTPLTYGDAAFNLSATGGASGNVVTFTGDNSAVATVDASGTVLIVGAGTVNITANQAGNVTYAAAPPVIRQLTINKASLTIQADNQTSTYGDIALPAFTASYTGFENGEDESVLTNPVMLSSAAMAGADAGSYPIFAAGATADNYQIIHLFGNLTIDKAALTITADDQSMTYRDAVPALTLSYAGFVNGEDDSFLNTTPLVTTTATAVSDAGTYAITVTGATSDNYEITEEAGTLTIDKATVNVTADDQSRVYGANDPTFSLTYVGFKGTDNELALDTQPTGTTTAASTSAVGTYSIVPSGGVDNNYAFTYTNGTLTIDPATLTVAVSNQTRTYGAANPNFELIYTGFANGEEATSLTTQPTASTTATASSGIGTYPITVSGGVSGNYAFTYVNATLTVNPATLTASAVGQSITYGEALPGLTFGYDGFVNDEDASVLITAPTASTTATSTSSAGTYPITVAGGVASNYLFSYVGADLTINQATLTVTAEDQSRSYGADNPALTFAYEGFVNGEDATVLTSVPTATTTATSTSSVGTYAITAAGGEDDNYAFSYTDGTLTVNPATLTVTAADQSKVYGSANPNLTVTYSGFQNGEDAAALTTVPTAATTASNTSSVGTYAITAAGGEAANYSLTYETGTLTVTAAELMVTADNQTRAFGEVNPAFTVTYVGFVNDEDESVVTASPTLATTADESSAPGTYSIEVSGTEATNYSITEVAGTLTVTKANQEITFDFLDVKTTADEAFELTAVSSSGLTISYASSDETVATVNGATVTIVGPGTSTITASQSGDDHYNAAADVQQQLVVTQANDTRITSSIEIDAIADQTVGNDAITLTATVRPVDAPISWEIISGPATIDGNILTLGDQAGLVQVKGSIKETDEYKGSEDVVAFALLDANLVTPVIDFILPTEALNTETVTLTATVDAQGATTVSEADVVYTVVSGPGEISTTNELSFTDIGRVIVSASLPATAETNAISAQSSVEVIALYNLSGTIRDENNNPFTDGLVIVGDLNDITNSQTTSINADGTYTFTALRSGDYELFVTPFSIDYVMTFYGDVSPVTDPDAVPLGLNITSDLTNIDVTLQLAPQSNVDLLPDDQGGVISFFAQNNLGNGNRFILGRTENGEPLPNTLVILKTAADEYVAADVTNDLGLIEFMGLPTGDYKLLVDIPGVGTMSADVGVQEGQQVDVTALIDESGANFNVDEVLSTIPEELKEIRVFPNPVQDYFEIRSLKRVEQVQLYDINGRMLERFGATDQYDIRTLPEGLYMIKITTNEGTTIQRLMKQ